VESTSLITRPT